MITPTWNHLWYVVYLLFYIAFIAPFLPMMQRWADGAGGRLLDRLTGGPMRLMTIVTLPFIFYSLMLDPLFPTTHDLVSDWANHAHRLTIFVLGYFAAKHAPFWRSVDRAWKPALALVVLINTFRLYMRAQHWDFYVMLHEETPVMTIVITLYAWSFIVMLLGFGQRYLNRPSRALTYLTGAVFCYYILHQTIIVAAGFYLTQFQLGAWPEFLGLTFITVASCGAGYEILRRLPGVRPWFGIKSPTQAGKALGASQIIAV